MLKKKHVVHELVDLARQTEYVVHAVHVERVGTVYNVEMVEHVELAEHIQFIEHAECWKSQKC